ncbi:MAG TPA: SoxR reducing system RseC family protein [Bacteroidales bacterium]|nr:SoxR reducing system RseC family protein [Bacteroidales bacterium]
MEDSHISHQGVVSAIHQNTIEVLIESTSACSTCKTKHLCGVSDSKEKIITVPKPEETFILGEKVIVIMTQKMGFLAVFLAYVLPFIIMIALMLVAHYTEVSEPVTGLLVVMFLTAYFFTLYAFRKKLNRKFTFTIKKL